MEKNERKNFNCVLKDNTKIIYKLKKNQLSNSNKYIVN